jgi:hypothetical protein
VGHVVPHGRAEAPDLHARRLPGAWRQDGKELYYLDGDGKMMAVDMALGPKLDSGTPRVLFDTGLQPNVVQDQYRVTPDGKRFLLLKPVEGNVPLATPIEITLNWTAALPK